MFFFGVLAGWRISCQEKSRDRFNSFKIMVILKIIGIILAVGFLVLLLWSIFKVASGESESAEKKLKALREKELKNEKEGKS